MGPGIPHRRRRHAGDLAHAVRPRGAQYQRGLDLERLRAAPRSYPLLPECQAPLAGDPEHPELPVVIEPGDLLCFSGAHLHASRPNRTGRTRLSIDTRIFERNDARAGRGAVNVDGRAPRVAWDWFRCLQGNAGNAGTG